MKQIINSKKIGMSVVLAAFISIGTTGCGGGDDSSVLFPTSTATDVTVERGKVYDAVVTDSSTPVQTAVEKSGQNIYTFANAPTYPIVVTGGWIDVNDNGEMDVNDTKLDIVMKSYSTNVTPITTYLADQNKTIRDQKLQELVDKLNDAGVGSDTNITAEDLLQVPSKAPQDVYVAANAIYKDMKENNGTVPDVDSVVSQFGTLFGLVDDNTTAKDLEEQVVDALVELGEVVRVSADDIAKYVQEKVEDAVDSVTPTETPTETTPPAETPTETSTTEKVDLSPYTFIMLDNNLNEAHAKLLIDSYSSNTNYFEAITEAPSSCADYGFTMYGSLAPTTLETGDGVKVTTYANADYSVVCAESDYSASPMAGTSNLILAYGERN